MGDKRMVERREGFSHMPCCGVYAVAIATGVEFHKVWDIIAAMQKRPNAWRGRTNILEREKAIECLGFGYYELHDIPKVTLKTFVDQYTAEGNMYIVALGTHIVAVKDGIVCDQYEHSHFGVNRNKRCRVQHAIVVI